MVNPGHLSLEIIRGIAFDEVILQCSDENVAVSGTLSPNAAGTFVLSGTYAAYPLYILAGSPSYFLYFNTAAASYVIAAILTNAALTNYWSPAVALTDPNGTYVAHGGNSGTAMATDNPIDLSAFTAEAQVRRTTKGEVLMDLAPTISTNEITLPAISKTVTDAIEFTGNFRWDLVLVEIATGERTGPYAIGPFVISDNITQI